MRIARSFGFVASHVTKKFMVILTASTVALAGLLSVALVTSRVNQAYAATPPDSCFVFDSATGSITDYGDGAPQWSGGPNAIGTCPTNVDIPSTIGGVAVTAITGQPSGYVRCPPEQRTD